MENRQGLVDVVRITVAPAHGAKNVKFNGDLALQTSGNRLNSTFLKTQHNSN